MPSCPVRHSTRLIRICLGAGVLVLAGCVSTPPEDWRAMMDQELVAYHEEQDQHRLVIPYSKGEVSFRRIRWRELSRYEWANFGQMETGDPDSYSPIVRILLNGKLLDLYSNTFPDSGGGLVGDVIGDPLPDWVLEENPELKPLHEKALSGNAGSMLALSDVLRKVFNPRHPLLSPLAYYWCRQSAELDFPPGCYRLSRMYKFGIGVVKDEGRADQLLRKSARLGYPTAINDLAWITAIDIASTPKDLDRAWEQVLQALAGDAQPRFMDTAALIEARRGNWASAINWQDQAVEAYSIGNPDNPGRPLTEEQLEMVDRMKTRLEAYRNRSIPTEVFFK